MLPTQPHVPRRVVEQGEGEIFIRAHTLHIAVQGAVQRIEKTHRVGFTIGQQGTHNGLGHHHQHATFQTVAGDVANADFNLAVMLQDIVESPPTSSAGSI